MTGQSTQEACAPAVSQVVCTVFFPSFGTVNTQRLHLFCKDTELFHTL